MSNEPGAVPAGMKRVEAITLSPEAAEAVRRLAGQLEIANAGDVFSVALRLVHMLALAHKAGGIDLVVVGHGLCVEAALNDVLSGRAWDFRKFPLGEGEG